MPTGVFDASLITQRARAKAESNSFINRIQNPTNPTTSYGPLTGIYDNSEVNRVTNGQMKYFQRNGACTVAYIGCPCTVLTPSGQVANNVVLILPGQVQNLEANYGSVIVSWTPPIDGGPVTSYTLTYQLVSGGPIVEITDLSSSPYIFSTPGLLTSGSNYRFNVFAVNQLGRGPAPSSPPQKFAPFVAPSITLASSPSNPNRIDINFSYSAFTVTGGVTQYILNKYVNGVLDPTQITGTLSSTTQIQITSGISIQNTYSFTLQLQNVSLNQFSSISNLPAPPVNVYPAGPTITSVTNITNNSARVNFVDYSSIFSLSGATCIVSGTGSSGVTATIINNESVTLNNLSSLTTYNGLQIAFQKTINGSVIISNTSSVTSFNTFGPAPVFTAYTANFTEAIIYYQSYPTITPNQATLTYTLASSSVTETVSAITVGATFAVFVIPDPSNPPDPLPQGESLIDISIVVANSTYSSLPGTVPNFLFVAAPQSVATGSSTNDVIISYTPYSNPVGLNNLSGARLLTNQGTFDTTIVNSNDATFDTSTGLQVGTEYTGCTLELFDSFNYSPTRYSAPSAPPFTFSLLYPAPTSVSTQDLTFKSVQINFMSSFEPNTGIFIYSTSATQIVASNISYDFSSQSGYMIIEGLAQATTYDTCKIRLTIGVFNSAETSFSDFTTTTPPQLDVTGQSVFGNDLQVTYDEQGSGGQPYTAFNPTSSVLTTNEGGPFNGSASSAQAVFNSLPSGNYTNCTITVTDGTYTATQNTTPFSFTIL